MYDKWNIKWKIQFQMTKSVYFYVILHYCVIQWCNNKIHVLYNIFLKAFFLDNCQENCNIIGNWHVMFGNQLFSEQRKIPSLKCDLFQNGEYFDIRIWMSCNKLTIKWELVSNDLICVFLCNSSLLCNLMMRQQIICSLQCIFLKALFSL